jgi:hypothetical protein
VRWIAPQKDLRALRVSPFYAARSRKRTEQEHGWLLIIIDELGKCLEFAALHPERQDVYFLQQRAELATSSGSEPIFTIGLLHQGFNAYAHQFSQSAQKEWEKVAGRFEELLFDHNLYDYAASNFGHSLSVQSYRNHWNHIDSLVRSFPSENEVELAVLKTAGLLNLRNTPALTPTMEALTLAVADLGTQTEQDAKSALQRLRSRNVLYSRGAASAYYLWSHTSLDLDAAYETAKRAVGSQHRVAARIKDRLQSRPIVARRHYIQTGNLRHFDVLYCGIAELEKVANDPAQNCDGRIVIPLCETLEEVSAATTLARSFTKRPDTLIGITQPLNALSGLLQEAERWTWIQKNTPELKDDRYAAEEVSRQVAHATQTFEKRVQHYAGLGHDFRPGESGISWYHRGKDREITSGANLLVIFPAFVKTCTRTRLNP